MPDRSWPDHEAIRQAMRTGDGRGVVVAILDTGIDPSHPDFSATRFMPPMQAGMNDSGPVVRHCPPGDDVGHGTAIAGILRTLAPAAVLLSVKVLDYEKRQHRHELIRAGARAAIDAGATILNCSFGSPGTSFALPMYKDWTDAAFASDRHVVAAAANAESTMPHWPAGFPQVLGVACADCPPDALRFQSLQAIPFSACGVDVPVPVPGGGHAHLTGSSFAAARVSGMAARILSCFPGLSPSFLHHALRSMADDQNG